MAPDVDSLLDTVEIPARPTPPAQEILSETLLLSLGGAAIALAAVGGSLATALFAALSAACLVSIPWTVHALLGPDADGRLCAGAACGTISGAAIALFGHGLLSGAFG